MYSKIQSKYHDVKAPEYTEKELKIIEEHNKLDKIFLKNIHNLNPSNTNVVDLTNFEYLYYSMSDQLTQLDFL